MSTDTNQIKYFGYCRKSSEDDGRQVLSLPAQKKELQTIAESNHLKVLQVYVEAKSAKAEGRELFNQMIARIKKGEARGIICWKLDRLARNMIDGGQIMDLLQRGVIEEIRTYEKPYLPTDNVMLMTVEFGMANQFIRDLSVNTKRGMRLKAELGQPPRCANLGYRNNLITHNWEPDPHYGPFIVNIFDWYDSGHYSESQIVERLVASGFRTKTGKVPPKSLIGRILRSEVYYGWFNYDGELKEGKYEPLVSKELWDRVQDRINGRVTYNHKKAKLVFKYRGYVFCGECGCSITAERKKGHIYYRCTKARGYCSQSYVREEDLEPQLLDIFNGVQLSKSDIESVHDELIALYEKDQIYQANTLKNLRTEFTKLQEEKMKVVRKLLLNDHDVQEDREIVLELKNDIAKRIQVIQGQIDALSDTSYSWLEQSSNLLKLANRATELFSAANAEQKRQLLDFVSSNRVLRDKKVVYEYAEPFVLAANIKSQNAERPDNLSGRPIWLRG